MIDIPLYFRPIDFYHLSGLHHVKDIDFGLHRKEYMGEKLMGVLLSKKMDDTLVEKSCFWPKMSDRLTAIIDLRQFLESEFEIYKFSPKKLKFFSFISAKFLLYNEKSGDGLFLFVDEENDEDIKTFYCKSIFRKSESDYRVNQSRWTILKKVKRDETGEQLLYLHARYKEPSK